MSVRSSMFLLVVVSTFLTVSCGKGVPASTNADVATGSIIVGDVNWQEVIAFDDSSDVRKNSKAVADIQFSNTGRCTGFLISDNVLMTNHHCITSAADVVGMKVFMKHEKGVSKSNQGEITCDEFIGNDEELDFALVKCEGTPGQTYGKVVLDTTEPVEGDSVYVIHQNCDYYTDYNCDWTKKVSEGKVVGLRGDVLYDADTLGGSSGSPVFNADSDKVYAIHHAGYGGWGGRGVYNGAVSMSRIVPFILENFPSVLAQDQDDSDSTDKPSSDNNTAETATDLGEGFSQYVEIDSEDDVDFYKAEMKAGEVLDFRIFFSHSEGDLDFEVLKKMGSSYKVVSRKESSSDNEAVRLRVNSSNTYYIKVFGYKGAKAKYKVQFKK